MIPDTTSNILITCARGIAPFLKKEILNLGFSVKSSHETGLVTEGTLLDTYNLNLRLRTGYNVLFLLKEFRCESPKDLYEETYKITWEDIIPEDEYITVVSQVDNLTITNVMFANQKLKDAVVDRMVKQTGQRPKSGPERRNIVINLYWKDTRAWIYLNTSGGKLADRGYRKIPLSAPMQETLASAVILATGYDGARHFVNPMCGSGTLAIEAALIALGKAPGLLRSNYGFMHLKDFDTDYWYALRKDMLKKAGKKLDFRIIATDIRQQAVDAAAKNAKTAGVDQLIEFKVCDFRNTEIPAGKGTVILNPEYGKRMGEAAKLADVYVGIGDFFKKKCGGYTGYIFTGNFDLAKKIRLISRGSTKFYNGKIECRLLKYNI
ncbi:MAG: class I SAM-dependent RNA methyltransferase [Candidatus Omnitrophica bacterium]|nr:class I SAM-dependent RNA methyltransferase [Candidatus Omnitrophota bacterium]